MILSSSSPGNLISRRRVLGLGWFCRVSNVCQCMLSFGRILWNKIVRDECLGITIIFLGGDPLGVVTHNQLLSLKCWPDVPLRVILSSKAPFKRMKIGITSASKPSSLLINPMLSKTKLYCDLMWKQLVCELVSYVVLGKNVGTQPKHRIFSLLLIFLPSCSNTLYQTSWITMSAKLEKDN